MADDADDVTCARFALGEFSSAPRPALDEIRPPALLADRYEVGQLIGSGGTARVYRARDLRLDRQVAVKIYNRDVVAVDQRRRLREMNIQAGITHPGVVALLDSGTENGRTFLVMQLVEGENLAERLLGGPMPAAEVTTLAAGLTEALTHVHARRVVHRDLKPANVFLSANGPLIGDFGIAHALDTTHITGAGVVPGTAAYLAPEQVSGQPAGPPADVYALGLILLECVTGQREYAGTMIEAAMARLTRPPWIPEDLPPSLAHTLRRMTRREPGDRPTAAEVREMLHAPVPVVPWGAGTGHSWWRRGIAAGLVASAGRRRGTAADAPLAPTLPHAITAEGAAAPAPAAATPSSAATPSTTVTRTRAAQYAEPPVPHSRRPRRLVAAAGVAAVALAAFATMLLTEPETGTSTPAQPPAPSSPAATTAPPASASAPLAGSGNPDPRVTESASLEPAAVTHTGPAGPAKEPKAGKPGKIDNSGNNGKGKGKGPGRNDS